MAGLFIPGGEFVSNTFSDNLLKMWKKMEVFFYTMLQDLRFPGCAHLSLVRAILRRKWVWNIRRMKLRVENRIPRREKPLPGPLCPPQMPHGLTQVETQTSAFTDEN